MKFINRIKEINSDIIIRDASIADCTNFIDLFNSYYRRKKNSEYFSWQFFNDLVPTKLFVAYKNNELAATYALQLRHLNNLDYCTFTIDLLIKEKYRNRGLFYLLEEEAGKFSKNNKAIAIVSLPNLHGMNAHKAIYGWKNAGKINSLILKKVDFKSSFEEIDLHNNIFVFFSKSPEYRKWRFDDCPDYNYVLIEDKNHNQVYVKLFSDPISGELFGDIVNYEFLDGKSNCMNYCSLIIRACEHLFAQDVKTITTWALPHTSYFKLFKHCGFQESLQERYFCIKVLHPDCNYLYNLSSWHLVQADSEVY